MTKHTLESIPFDELFDERRDFSSLESYFTYCSAKATKPSSWFSRNSIEYKPWILEQLLALLASHKLPRSPDSLILGSEYFRTNLDPASKWDRGLIVFLLASPRGLIVKNQTKSEGLPYCALVPLVLAAHKKYNGIPYSEWDKDTLSSVVDSTLCEAMLFNDFTEIDDNDLRDARMKVLTVASGPNTGAVLNAATAYRVTKIQQYALNSYPHLVKLMQLQLWAAHPSNRHEYMVLDPRDWDNSQGMPVPLISGEVLISDIPTQITRSDDDWWKG